MAGQPTRQRHRERAHAMFRPATIDDAAVLAELVNYAGEGMPLYLWGQMAEAGEAAWGVGWRRAAREEGSFYRNATIIEHDGQCAGCLIGYEIPDNPQPIPSDMPAIFVPPYRNSKTSRRAHRT